MKKILTILICASILCLASCSKSPGFRTATETANTFMLALKNNDNETSWNLLSKSRKAEMGNTAAWADYTLPRHFDEWSFTSITISDSIAQIFGEARLGIDPYLVTLILEKSGEGWLVSEIEFSLK
jgi:hypothetical protein